MNDSPIQFEVVRGNVDIGLSEVAHILVPGRGRNSDGSDVSTTSRHILDVVVRVWPQVRHNNGLVVCSGYKTPYDLNGRLWEADGDSGLIYTGTPEAVSMARILQSRGIPKERIRVEHNSIDTVTNFVRSETEGYFGDSRPVAIVAESSHLDRMLKLIAPKVLDRDFIGVAVRQANTAPEGRAVRAATRLILLRINPRTANAIPITTRRASRLWRLASTLQLFFPWVKRYNTDGPSQA